jgi:hypothetical protein
MTFAGWQTGFLEHLSRDCPVELDKCQPLRRAIA